MAELLLGVDGGGTKTECVLCDGRGNALARCVTGASNPNGQPLEHAFSALGGAIEGVLRDYGGLSARVHAFVGVAGCAAPVRKDAFAAYLHALLPNAISLRNASDTVNCLSCGIGAKADGVIAISGTGSSCFARRAGEMLRVGGWGYLFQDEGSGYEMGRAALIRAMRARDGRGRQTLLESLCEEKLGASLSDGLGALYEGGRTFVASFSRCVSEAFEKGDEAAREILDENARGIAEQIRAASALLPCGEPPVVLTGALWRAIPYYRERALLYAGAGLRFLEIERAPVYGAIVEAASQCGVCPEAPFEAAFDEGYANLL